MNTLIVNLLGGPGSGKSTSAAGLFFILKTIGVNCELVSEYVKDKLWEGHRDIKNDQIYIFGKQNRRQEVLVGQVDVVITDSPIILSAVYDPLQRENLRNVIMDQFLKFNNFNAFIDRVKEYNPVGRFQNEDEAKGVDRNVLGFLTNNSLPFYRYKGDVLCPFEIAIDVIRLLEESKNTTDYSRRFDLMRETLHNVLWNSRATWDKR